MRNFFSLSNDDIFRAAFSWKLVILFRAAVRGIFMTMSKIYEADLLLRKSSVKSKKKITFTKK